MEPSNRSADIRSNRPASRAAITVLMSCYNCETTVGAAVESILTQSYRDFRLVIYDDGSTDGTATALKCYDDPRIDLRLLSENRGLSQNLHEGLIEAETPYIARMDSDDIALPERLADQIEFLESHPSVDVLGTNVLFFTEKGDKFLGIQPEHHEEIAISLFFDFTMLHPTIMMRTSALSERNWNYNPRFIYSQDFDLWSRMIPEHRFYNLQKPLLLLREHPRKISRAKRSKQQRFTTLIRARQIRRVRPDATLNEVLTFSAAARGDLPKNAEALDRLQSCLLRLIEGNEITKVYEPHSFNSAAANLMDEICRQMLRAGKIAGSRYLVSPLRKHAVSHTVKSQLKFAGLCGIALLKRRIFV